MLVALLLVTLATIHGQVVAPGRINSLAIEVTLEKAPNRVIGRTSTDNSGNFEFRNLEPGRYEVVVNLDGYQQARQSVDLEDKPEMIPVEPTDDGTDPAARPIAIDTGGLDQSNLVYIVLTRIGADGPSDPELVALGRKYPKKILQDYEKVQEEIRKGNSSKAIERLEALVKEAPDFFSGHHVLGGFYQRQNRFREAEREYKRAHDVNPLSALPLVSLGGLYLQEADATVEKDPDAVGRILDDALDTLEEAIQIEPHAAAAYYLLGTAYFKSAFYEDAEANLKRALDIESAMVSARLMLINVYLRQENWKSALEHLDLYTTQNPNATNRTQIQEIRSKVIETLGGSK